jgi:hypothetical protein
MRLLHQVDPAKLNTLKELIAGPDYKKDMQRIIRTIFEFAYMTYSGEGGDVEGC